MADESIKISLEFYSNVQDQIKIITGEAKKLGDQFEKLGKSGDKGMSSPIEKATKEGGMLSEVFTKIKGKLGAIGLAIGAAFGAKEIYEATIRYDKLRTTLGGYTKDLLEANGKLEDLNMAGQGLVPLDEMTRGYIALRNVGIDPSMDAMSKFSTFALSMGKSAGGFMETVSAAILGNTRGLKQYGISVDQSKKHGDMLQVSFKGVSKEIKNTNKDLEAYLESLGAISGVAGAMDRSKKTLSGAQTSFKSTLEDFTVAIGDKFSTVFTTFLNGLTSLVGSLTEAIKETQGEKLEKRDKELEALFKTFKEQSTSANEYNVNYITDQIEAIAPAFFAGVDKTKFSEVNKRLEEYKAETTAQKEKEKLGKQLTGFQTAIPQSAQEVMAAEKKAFDALSEIPKNQLEQMTFYDKATENTRKLSDYTSSAAFLKDYFQAWESAGNTGGKGAFAQQVATQAGGGMQYTYQGNVITQKAYEARQEAGFSGPDLQAKFFTPFEGLQKALSDLGYKTDLQIKNNEDYQKALKEYAKFGGKTTVTNEKGEAGLAGGSIGGEKSPKILTININAPMVAEGAIQVSSVKGEDIPKLITSTLKEQIMELVANIGAANYNNG
jgi:hypothetical protein